MERFYQNLQASRTAIEACGLGVMLYSYLNCSGAWKLPQGWRSTSLCCIVGRTETLVAKWLKCEGKLRRNL